MTMRNKIAASLLVMGLAFASGGHASLLTFEEVGDIPNTGIHQFTEVGDFTFETIRCNCPNPGNHLGVRVYNAAQAPDDALNYLYNTPNNVALLSESIDTRMSLTSGGLFDLNSLYLATAGAFPPVVFYIDGYREGVLTQSKSVTVKNSTEIGGAHLENIGFLSVDKVEWRVETEDGTYWGPGLDTINYSVVPIPAAAWLFGSGLIGLVGMQRRQRS
jgi:hypothetical protein